MVYKLTVAKQPLLKIPVKVGGAAHVNLTAPGATYLHARSINPAAAPGPAATAKPASFVKSVTPLRGAGGNKATKTATAQDTLAQITARYIASMPTAAQQTSQINAALDASQKASAAAINAAYADQNRTLLQQQDRAHQYAMALGSLRDQSGAQTEADYQNAAARIQGLGTGLTGTVADAQQATADDAAQRIAAATSGLGQAKGLDVAGLQNTAQYTGVTQPATDLYGEAANRAAQARLNQDVMGQQVENIATGYGTQIGTASTEKAAKLAELAAQRPSLYQQALTAAQSGGRSDMATIISALALQNQTAKVPSEIGKNVADANATTSNANTGVAKVTGIKNGQLVKGFYFSGAGTKKAAAIPTGWRLYSEGDPSGHVIVPSGEWYFKGKGMTNPQKMPWGYRLDPNDPTNHKIVLNPQQGAKGTAKGTAKQIQGLVKTWSGKFDKEMTMDASPYAVDIQNPILESKLGKPPIWAPKPGMTYAKAKADLIGRLPPALKGNKQMLANIDTSLARVGFKKPSGTVTKAKAKPGIQPPTAGALVGGGQTKLP